MAHTELNLRERRTIEDMLNAMISIDEIAAEIGRHRSTVYREIKRNRFVDDELPRFFATRSPVFVRSWIRSRLNPAKAP